MTVRIMLKSIAHMILWTLNPGTIAEARSIIRPFRIKPKSPSVKIFIGSVSMKRTGLSNVFKIPRTTATITAVKKLFTFIPGKIYAVTKTANPLTRRFTNIFI